MQAAMKMFRGGIHLDGHKALSAHGEIKKAALPAKLVLALRQHSGRPAIACVGVGDRVKKGQCIATAAAGISAPLHAPTSGVVEFIGPSLIAHPSGEKDDCIVIVPDGHDECDYYPAIINPLQEDAAILRDRITQAGIVGLGGAVFPSAVKLDPVVQADTLVINGVECEPYITCDDMLMRNRPYDILKGIAVLLHITAAGKCLVGIEDNKPEAARLMDEALQSLREAGLAGMQQVEIVTVPTRFPAGSEKQLIYTLTGKVVPSGGLPRDIGVICNNVGTAAAIHDAVFLGKPLISRIVSVTGEAVPRPANYEVLIGTPVSELLTQCGLQDSSDTELVMGGPMMGIPLTNDDVPVGKGSNCILARQQQVKRDAAHMPCIRCGTCVSVCPVNLLPQQMYWYARAKKFDKVENHHVFDCIECGCCAYVCPSEIPLVDYFRFAKHAVIDQRNRQQKAELARERNDARLQRLEQEKREKEEARKKRRAARSAAAKKKKTASPGEEETAVVKDAS